MALYGDRSLLWDGESHLGWLAESVGEEKQRLTSFAISFHFAIHAKEIFPDQHCGSS